MMGQEPQPQPRSGDQQAQPVVLRPHLVERIHNLPALLSSLVGRAEAIPELRRILVNSRLLTLTGPGGIGKTRLALALGEAVLPDYVDGVWLVELAALADPELVPLTVASVLRVREVPREPLSLSLAIALQSKDMVLVLDNCEHLVQACAQLAETLLRACPELRVVATSRQPLSLFGERVWEVPSLGVPELDTQRRPAPEDVLGSDAIQLFVERARAADVTFALPERSVGPLVEVCRRLDGIPLGIELAASTSFTISSRVTATTRTSGLSTSTSMTVNKPSVV